MDAVEVYLAAMSDAEFTRALAAITTPPPLYTFDFDAAKRGQESRAAALSFGGD